MKKIFFVLTACVSLAFMGSAQDKKIIPLLGSTQDIYKSAFCKKYQCIVKYDNQKKIFTHFVLNMPDDDPLFYERLGRTNLFIREDSKKQLIRVSITLSEDFRSNFATNRYATVMLSDLLYYAVNKRMKITKVMGEDFSLEINDCFFKASARPRENIEELTRVLTTGEIILQVEKKRIKYQAVCSRRFNGSTPKMYTPGFWIEIPSITEFQNPVYRYR